MVQKFKQFFFDLQKAFDTVPHTALISKLTDLEIPTHLVAWISDYLYKRQQQVGIDGVKSPPVDVISGVPQGSVLGPLLFLLYIDGLARIQLHGGSITMFADDLLLYKVIRTPSDFDALQYDVNTLVQYISDHDLKLNVQKCKSLLISRRRNSVCSQPVKINEQPLEKVDLYKYLGVLISSDLSWSQHISYICSRAKRQLGLLYRHFYRDTEPNSLKMLYLTQVRPLLEYAVPVWDPYFVKDVEALESVQKFAAKMCTKSWQRWSYSEQLRALNLTTLKERRDYLKLCFLYKVFNNLIFFPESPLELRPPSATRSHDLTLDVPFAHTGAFYNSFFCQTPRLWNELPQEVVTSTSIASFKRTYLSNKKSCIH